MMYGKRKPHVMGKTKRSELPQSIVYFDSESRVELDDSKFIDQVLAGELVEKEHDCYLICASFVNRGTKKEDDREYYGNGFKHRFWKDVDQYTAAGRKTYVFAHNAGYDCMVTGAAHYLVKFGYTVIAFSDDNPFILTFRKKEGDKTKTICILSSTNYYKNSLAELGKIFGLEKLESAFNDTLEKSLVYCRRDVDILKVAMNTFIDFIDQEDLGTFAQTIAGQAFAAFRHRFMQHDIYIHTDERALAIERESYCGGRTEAWQIGSVGEKVFCCDINSEYPFVMLSQKYPTFLKTIRNKLTIPEVLDFVGQGYLVVARCKVNTDLPIFPVKKRRLLFPVGDYETTLCTPEIIEGIKRGYITELKDICIYESEYLFADYVDYFYTARLKAKHEKNEVLSLLFKYFMNSLYGKFGQRAIDWEIIGEADPEIIKVERILNYETGNMEMVKIFGGSVFKNVKKEGNDNEAHNSFPAISAHVTSYARVLLWQYVDVAGIENVYYMDTDSIFTNEIGYNNLLAAGCIDPDRLGALKLEKTGTVEIFGVKDYIFNGKAKVKGIPKSAIKITDKTYVVNTWVGMSHMISKGDLNSYHNRLQKKELKREYIKGNVYPNGKVKPYTLVNGELIFDDQCTNYKQTFTEYNVS